MEEFPHKLFGYPLLRSYNIDKEKSYFESKMEDGTIRRRRRTINPYNKLTTNFTVTREKLAAFEIWWKHRAKHGTEWFLMETDSGVGITKNKVIANDGYKAMPLSDKLWEIKFTVTCENMVEFPEWYLDFYTEYGVTPDESMNLLNILVNVKLPRALVLETY